MLPLLSNLFFSTDSRRLLNLQRKVYCSMVQLSYFMHNEWTFQNSKALSILDTEVPPAEREIFGYDYKTFSVEDYFR